MSDERTRMQIEERRRLRELERAERRMAAAEHALEEQLEELDRHIQRAQNRIDADLRIQHWGHEPEHPPPWSTLRLEP